MRLSSKNFYVSIVINHLFMCECGQHDNVDTVIWFLSISRD